LPPLRKLSGKSATIKMRLKIKKKTLVLLAALTLLASSYTNADAVLSMYFVFYKNDSVELKQMKVIEGQESITMPPGEYRFVTTGEKDSYVIYSESRTISFISMSDPPKEEDKAAVLMRMPYTKDMKNLKIYKGSKLLLSKSLDICNSNGICDTASETYLNCPQDCPLDKPDGWCTQMSDGICDPDCVSGLDPDCNSKPVKYPENTPANQETITTTLPSPQSKKTEDAASYILLIGAIVIVFASLIAYRSTQKRKIIKEREDFIKWKEEQERLKNAGKPSA
jgi:hypothetical protein